MGEKFGLGLLLGLGAGALIVANSVKVRQMIVKKQQEVQNEVSKMTEKATKKDKQ